MRTVGHKLFRIANDYGDAICFSVVPGTFDTGIFGMAKRGREEGTGRKTEVVTVRLDPKLKYLAELGARKQRRPLSSYIEWAVEQSLSLVVLEEDWNSDKVTVADAERSRHLWDLDEPDRIVRLALNYPDLLTHEEQIVWKLVRENGLLWKGSFKGDPATWTWQTKDDSIIWDRLRDYWPIFRAVANGTKPPTDLPTWTKLQPAPVRKLSDVDDDIPF